MRPIVDTDHVHDGVPGLRLEGDRVRVTVFPEAGAKIFDLVHLETGENLLWQNPRVPLRRTYAGAAFDDVWCGGWDELFPTDTPCEVGDNTFHDHGDLWCGPWEWTVEEDNGETATVFLQRYGIALPCLVQKWITVDRDGLDVRFRHRLVNLGFQPVSYVWNLHVAHAITPRSRIDLPVASLDVVAVQPGRFEGAASLRWPEHDGIDLRAMPPPDAGLTEWLHTAGVREGWCEVVHADRGVGLRLAFDPDLFRTTWLWGVYGGWRGHYLLLTEPCTSAPGGLASSIADGTAASLAPGEELETTATATILEGVE